MAIFMVHNGFGRNIIYLTPIQIQHWGLYVDISMMLFTIGTGSTRISVCLFVLRLVPATKTFYRRWIWGLLTLFTIITIADFLAQCFQCIPLPGLWDKSVKARCFPESHMTQIAKVQGGTYTSSRFRSQILDSHKRRLCCHNGPPLRAVACFAFAKYSNQPAGQSSDLSDHRSWNCVCQENLLARLFIQTDL